MIVENRVGGCGRSVPQRWRSRRRRFYAARRGAHTIAPALYKTGLPPGARFCRGRADRHFAGVLVVSPAKGIKSAAELVAAAKARPNALNFSSVGIGTATHLSVERFQASAGIQAVHIPFKGGAEAMTEVIAGRADFFFGPVALVLPHIRDGKLAALAVNTDKRSAALPQVPTTREAGFSDAEYPIWFGLFAPAGTPREIVERLHRETVRVPLRTPKVQEKARCTRGRSDAHVARRIRRTSSAR